MNKLDFLINYLLSERKDIEQIKIPETEQEKFNLYRSLVNIRPAVLADDSFLSGMRPLFQENCHQPIPPGVYLQDCGID